MPVSLSLQGLLYVSSFSGLVEVPVANCSNYPSCGECVLSRDPYCAWTGRQCLDVRQAPPGRSVQVYRVLLWKLNNSILFPERRGTNMFFRLELV